MNTLSLIPAPVLDLVAILVVGLSGLMIALHAGILLLAAERTSLTPRARLLVPRLRWVYLPRALAGRTAQPSTTRLPRRQPQLARGPLSQFSSPSSRPSGRVRFACGFPISLRLINSATPPEWLIAVQTYRIVGMIFIWPFMTAGVLPPGFALPAGIGDFITGLAAPFIAGAVAGRRVGAFRWARAWNWFGIIDLIVAPTAAVLSEPG